jgi:hypothetical protein
MHPYPTGTSGYIHSFNDTSDISLSLGNDANEEDTTTYNTNLGHWNAVGHLMAFAAGLVVAVLGMHFLQGRNRRRNEKVGYTPVPDSANDDMVQLISS